MMYCGIALDVICATCGHRWGQHCDEMCPNQPDDGHFTYSRSNTWSHATAHIEDHRRFTIEPERSDRLIILRD